MKIGAPNSIEKNVINKHEITIPIIPKITVKNSKKLFI